MEVTDAGIMVFLHAVNKVLSLVRIRALQLSLLSYTGLLASTVIEVRPPQPENAPSPIEVTELGMFTEVRPLQP